MQDKASFGKGLPFAPVQCLLLPRCMHVTLCLAVVVIRQGVRAGVSALSFALPTFHLLLCLQVPANPWPLSLVVTSPHSCQADGSLARGSQLTLFVLFIIPAGPSLGLATFL